MIEYVLMSNTDRTKEYDSVPEMESKLLANGWLRIENEEVSDYDYLTQVKAGEPTYTESNGVAVRSYTVTDRPLVEAKEQKLDDIREIAQLLIYEKYPIWKQANAANGIYSEVESAPMLVYIGDMVDESNRCEGLVNIATTLTEIRNVTPNWPSE